MLANCSLAAALAVAALGSIVVAVALAIAGSRVAAELLGPGTALWICALVRHGLGVFVVAATLRLVARRVEGMVGLELLVVAGAWATALATHRHGVVDRPLWLSDWATSHGFAPAAILLAIGAAASLVLGGLLLAQSSARRRLGGIVVRHRRLEVLALGGRLPKLPAEPAQEAHSRLLRHRIPTLLPWTRSWPSRAGDYQRRR